MHAHRWCTCPHTSKAFIIKIDIPWNTVACLPLSGHLYHLIKCWKTMPEHLVQRCWKHAARPHHSRNTQLTVTCGGVNSRSVVEKVNIEATQCLSWGLHSGDRPSSCAAHQLTDSARIRYALASEWSPMGAVHGIFRSKPCILPPRCAST